LSADENARRDVQIRRLADLELLVLDGRGAAVAGVPVALSSTEFACDVRKWIEEKRIQAPAELTTDALGKLSVPRLPHGPYAWSVSVDGQDVTGCFELQVGRKEPVLIRLP
jgi:hypothetical protein